MASKSVIILFATEFVKIILGGNLCFDLMLKFTLTNEKPTEYLSVKLQVTESLNHCASVCALTRTCASFLYKKTTRECRLYKAKLSALNLLSEEDLIGYMFDAPPPCNTELGYEFNLEAYMCYKVHSTKKTWIQARDTCIDENAEMIMLNTHYKRQIIEHIVETDGLNEYFLGATNADGEWRWVADNFVISWVPASHRLGMCMELEPSLRYDDTECNGQLQKFVCEIMI